MMTLRESFPEVGAPTRRIVEAPVRDDVLKAVKDARELIIDPKHWIQGMEHVKTTTEITEGVFIKRRRVVEVDQFCVLGALREVAPEIFLKTSEALSTFLDQPVHKMNDHNSHDHVISQLDAFIAAQERRAA